MGHATNYISKIEKYFKQEHPIPRTCKPSPLPMYFLSRASKWSNCYMFCDSLVTWYDALESGIQVVCSWGAKFAIVVKGTPWVFWFVVLSPRLIQLFGQVRNWLREYNSGCKTIDNKKLIPLIRRINSIKIEVCNMLIFEAYLTLEACKSSTTSTSSAFTDEIIIRTHAIIVLGTFLNFWLIIVLGIVDQRRKKIFLKTICARFMS